MAGGAPAAGTMPGGTMPGAASGVVGHGGARPRVERTGALCADDPAWRASCLVEISTTGVDPDFAGVGSSPGFGDFGASYLIVPAAPTATQLSRYLFRLASVYIPPGAAVILRDYRQYLEIWSPTGLPTDAPPVRYPTRIQVVTPMWRFLDGNVSWHIVHEPARDGADLGDSAQAAGTDPSDGMGSDTAMRYVPPLSPYVPPASGMPAGDPVGSLGVFRDVRRAWGADGPHELDYWAYGSGKLTFYASVRQTDAANRPKPDATGFDIDMLSDEDRFVIRYPDAAYHAVAGMLLVEVLPCTPNPNVPHRRRPS